MIRFILVQLLVFFAQNTLGCVRHTVCDEQDLNIDCGAGKVIVMVNAEYGRRDVNMCGKEEKFSADKPCVSSTSKSIAVEKCHFKQSCSLKASASVFDDPCAGIAKYLSVIYTCLDVKTEQACEGQVVDLKCGHGRFINIQDAFYGREDKDTCGTQENFSNLCSEKDTLSKVKKICEGKSKCSVKSDNTELGDPCKDMTEYLKVNYTCEKFKTEEACDSNSITLSCEDGRTINIHAAFYGRDNRDTCGTQDNFKEICSQSDSMTKVKESCQGKHTCTIKAENSALGDPCPEMTEYLRVKYDCVKEGHSELTCDGDELSIDCGAKELIKIDKVFYGREDPDTCGKQEKFSKLCATEDSLSKVTGICQDKHSCKVKSSNDLLGDPCIGMTEYLKVDYQCKSAPCKVIAPTT